MSGNRSSWGQVIIIDARSALLDSMIDNALLLWDNIYFVYYILCILYTLFAIKDLL